MAKRKNLLAYIRKIQKLVGKAKGDYLNDRAPDRATRVLASLDEAFELCLRAQEGDPPE